MSGLAFFDSNVFLYTDDSADLSKRERATQLIGEYQRTSRAVVSLQVLQEYFSVATRKLGVEADVAQRKVEIMARMRMVRFEARDVVAAIELHRLHRISFWDSMILQAAKMAGAEVLYSEDLQAGAAYGGVRVVNPFA